MIPFRKHAINGTRCRVSLETLPRRGDAGRCFAALIILLFVGSVTAFAQPQPGRHFGKHKAGEPSTRAQADETKPNAKVPISIKRLDTPDGPGIIAIIGAFPSDLGEAGQAYLERKFFQHVVAAVLLRDESYALIEVAMLPQNQNRREGDFILGKLTGHITVVVEKRRVIITCTFTEAEDPQQIAAVRALIERVTDG